MELGMQTIHNFVTILSQQHTNVSFPNNFVTIHNISLKLWATGGQYNTAYVIWAVYYEFDNNLFCMCSQIVASHGRTVVGLCGSKS